MQPTTRWRDTAAALPEELVEEILLRISPEEPVHLIRAAMVCKAWCRILSDGGFRRRYSRFHRTPTLLGYFFSGMFKDAGPEFVPTTSFSPPPVPTSSYYIARDCRHNRVLIRDNSDESPGFIVWDLITGNRQHLSFPACAHIDQQSYDSLLSTEAVLCARHQHGCDHLDCHGGPFLVVSVRTHIGAEHHAAMCSASVYSSETRAWIAETSYCTANQEYYFIFGDCMESSLLIGDALYFTLTCDVIRIVKYDLGSHGLSVIDTPQVSHMQAITIHIDGGLGILQFDGNCFYTWSRQVDLNGGVGVWVRHIVAELDTLMPTWHTLAYASDSIRFIEGTNTVLLCLIHNNEIDSGVFTLNLKSRQLRKVAERWEDDVLPYTSFYAPDLAKGKLPPR